MNYNWSNPYSKYFYTDGFDVNNPDIKYADKMSEACFNMAYLTDNYEETITGLNLHKEFLSLSYEFYKIKKEYIDIEEYSHTVYDIDFLKSNNNYSAFVSDVIAKEFENNVSESYSNIEQRNIKIKKDFECLVRKFKMLKDFC